MDSQLDHIGKVQFLSIFDNIWFLLALNKGENHVV